MKTTHDLYQNTVKVTFDPDARTNRYIVEDEVAKLDKQPVPGVTSVLDLALNKKGLMTFPLNTALTHLGAYFDDQTSKWALKEEITLTSDMVASASKAWTVRSEGGRDAGTQIHTELENLLVANMNGTDYETGDVPSEVRKAYVAFRDWYNTSNATPLAVEQICYSRQHTYCGTFDALFEIDGKTVLVDFKSTNPSRYGLKVDGKWTGIYPEAFLQLGAYGLAYEEEHMDGGIVIKSELTTVEGDKIVTRDLMTEEDKKPLLIDDLMVINITKTGECHTLRASELGLKVEDCENQFLHARSLVNFINSTKRGKK